MAEPFLSEIRLFSFTYAPLGWALCNGQFLPINQNQGLFSLLGTTYGGNGTTTFALPDLRARVPVHFGNGVVLGERGGADSSTLTAQQLPPHEHLVPAAAVDAATVAAGTPAVPAITAKDFYVSSAQGVTTLAPGGAAGGSQPHENRMPSAVITFCIALQGIFPSPT